MDEPQALAAAKERLYGLRKTALAHSEAQTIQQRHGSRKSGLPPSGLPPSGRRTRSKSSAPSKDSEPSKDNFPPQQGELF